MAYYDTTPSWSPAGRQGPWSQAPPAPPGPRPGATPTSTTDDSQAFFYQIANVDKAIETWRKASKAPFDPRVAMGPRFPPTEYDPMRSMSAVSMQFNYSGQRLAARAPDVDPALQAKRRMAAERERDLRNYHQEQQFQKHLSGAKPERTLSPNTGMSEEDRRELIASQHRALYGANSNIYSADPSSRPLLSDLRGPASNPPGLRNSSPYDPFGLGPNPPAVEPIGTREPKDGNTQSRSREGSTSSPGSNNQNSFGQFDSTTQASTHTTTSSPGNADSPSATARGKPAPTSAASAVPIGTRPSNGPTSSTSPASVHGQSSLQKPRATTPLPSPLSFGYSAVEGQQGAQVGEKNGSPSNEEGKNGSTNLRGSGPWGNGVWGGKGGLGVQAKVWG